MPLKGAELLLLRLYEMFMGPLEVSKPWSTKGIAGVKRFLDRVWRISELEITEQKPPERLLRLLHKTIKKISGDTKSLQFNLGSVILVDIEGQRNISLRYLCGYPRDALLFFLAGGWTVLLPWDVPLAEERSFVDRIMPYTDYDRSIPEAVKGILCKEAMDLSSRVELSGNFSFPTVMELKRVLPEVEFICLNEGIEKGTWELAG